MRHIDLSLSKVVNNLLDEVKIRKRKKYTSDLQGKINKAIDRKVLVSFYYDDRKGKKDQKYDENGKEKWGNPKNCRTILVWAFYKSNQNGEDTIRAFHWSDRHTKRGPHLWKEFKINQIKYFRISSYEYTDEEVPKDARWDGDAHAAKLYNIVKRGEPAYEEDVEMSPEEIEMERHQNDIKGFSSDYLYPNHKGPLPSPKIPFFKKHGNLKSLKNFGKPGNLDYRKAYDEFLKADGKKALKDWDKAEAERNDQQSQDQRPMNSPQNTSGPINTGQQQNANQYNNLTTQNNEEIPTNNTQVEEPVNVNKAPRVRKPNNNPYGYRNRGNNNQQPTNLADRRRLRR